jgi:hypothetical protein
MKASSIKRLTVALFILLALIFGGQVLRSPKYFDTSSVGYDARTRYGEICCAHQGVNSFRIWNREMTLPGFAPLPRPDYENVSCAPNELKVHAYPPWHTVIFYWYGWLSMRVYLLFTMIFFWSCIGFIVYECLRLAKARFENYGLLVGVSLALVVYDVEFCFCALNYSVFILALILLMNKALEGKHEILAGLAWAVIMMKPQIGLLFVWPLFWRRHYLTIVTAILTCLAGTVITSFIVHDSVIDLILQIPQIGWPYPKGVITEKIFQPFLGERASIVVMGLFFILTGFVTWFLRKNRDFLVCCIPVIFVIPVWTYSITYDRVVLLPAYLFLLGQISKVYKPGGRGIIKWYYCATAIFLAVWTFLSWQNLISFVPGEKILYILFKSERFLEWAVSVLVFLVLLVRKEFEPKREGGSAAEI